MASRESIAQGNHLFFMVIFPQFLFDNGELIRGAIWRSLSESVSCGVSDFIHPECCHYLQPKVIFPDGAKENESFEVWIRGKLEKCLNDGIVEDLPLMFTAWQWSGMNELIVVESFGWKFSFKIVNYERDGDHDFRLVECPWDDVRFRMKRICVEWWSFLWSLHRCP